jgi:predicted Zn-dependent protease
VFLDKPQRAAFLLIALALAACSKNPVTGRSQFMVVSEDSAIAQARGAYVAELKPYNDKGKLDSDPALAARVQRITNKLIAQAIAKRPDAANWDWEIRVLDDPKAVNAFCMPGGKMAVYTGLMQKVKPSDDELANVLGHEIGHAIAGHGAERMSVSAISELGVIAVAASTGKNANAYAQGAQLGALLAWQLPNSRDGEAEADRIGIELAARAGYDPRAAATLWKKMVEASGDKSDFDWLSTHPAGVKRIEALQALAPKMMPYYESREPRPMYEPKAKRASPVRDVK